MIRAATAADLPAVSDIYAHYVADSTATWTYSAPNLSWWEGKLAEIDADGLPFLVVDDGGEMVGFAFLSTFRNRDGWRRTVEDTIYLRPGASGRGHGRRLLAALLDAPEPGRVREVVAMISEDIDESIALHRKLGFRETGRLPGVGEKFGQARDCVILQRSMPETTASASSVDVNRPDKD